MEWDGSSAFGFIDGWVEVVGQGLRWFLCIVFWPIRRSAPSPLAAKPLASLCLFGMDSEDDAMSPWDREA